MHRRILVIDDNPRIRAALGRGLAIEGFIVDAASKLRLRR
jgi:DNA-binding response OmpR family regulator